jgi:hypothetical protein
MKMKLKNYQNLEKIVQVKKKVLAKDKTTLFEEDKRKKMN